MLGLVGCDADGATSVWMTADSAGVRVVTSEAPSAEWGLSSEPELSIGVVDNPGPYEFFRVRDVAFLDEDRFAVANQGTEQVRFFSARGDLLGEVGREGSGPEEFRGLTWLSVRSDSLWAYDNRNDRISVRDNRGRFGRSFRLEWTSGLLSAIGVFTDGRVLGLTVRPMTQLPGEGTLLEEALISTFEPDGTLIDSIVRLPSMSRVVHRDGQLQTTITLPMSVNASFVPFGPGFCYTHGPRHEVRCFDGAGTLTTIMRLAVEVRPVTDEDIERIFDSEVASARAAGNDVRAESFLRARPNMVFPDAFPAFTDLETDDENRLWGRRYSVVPESEVRWEVFEQGKWLATLRLDPSFTLMDVRGERVIGVWRDELGVEYIRIYRVERDAA